MYTYGCFMLMYGRNQHDIVNQQSSNGKYIYKKHKLSTNILQLLFCVCIKTFLWQPQFLFQLVEHHLCVNSGHLKRRSQNRVDVQGNSQESPVKPKGQRTREGRRALDTNADLTHGKEKHKGSRIGQKKLQAILSLQF